MTVLSFIASTSAFLPVANRPNVVIPFAARRSKIPLFSSLDLESEPESTPAPKEELLASEVKPVATDPVVDTTPPKSDSVTQIETSELVKPLELNLEPGDSPAPSVINVESTTIEIPSEADSNIDLGDASLIVGPLVVLAAGAAGRQVLSQGAAKREEEQQAQQERAALQARNKTRKVEGYEVGIAKAVVSAPCRVLLRYMTNFVAHHHLFVTQTISTLGIGFLWSCCGLLGICRRSTPKYRGQVRKCPICYTVVCYYSPRQG